MVSSEIYFLRHLQVAKAIICNVCDDDSTTGRIYFTVEFHIFID